MPIRIKRVCASAACALGLLGLPAMPAVSEDGVIKVKSAYSMDETVARLKKSVADKGIMFFLAVEQSKLAEAAGVKLNPSTLLVFGNPGLGGTFIASNPISGLDWPVRLLVFENEKGEVWAAYTDFATIARRHRIEDRHAEFTLASSVIASITASVQGK